MKLTNEQIEDATRMATTPDLPNFSKAGTGKTHTTLEAIRQFKPKQTLVLCPPIAMGWWKEQATAFLGVDAKVLTGGGSKLAGDFVITSYDIARNAAPKLYEYFDSGALVLDESQYVRKVDARRTQAVFGLDADGRGGLVERFDTAWCLSGTPMEGYADDLWTQAGLLHPEVLDKYGIQTYEQFARAFTYRKKKQFNPQMQPVWKISGNTNEGLLHRLIYEDIKALRRQEAPGMPALSQKTLHVSVKLTKEVRQAMTGLSAAEILEKFNSGDEVLARLWKLIGLAKVAAIVPYSVDLMRNGPLLLGCWHREVMVKYSEALTAAGFKVVQVSGSTSHNKRDEIRTQFNRGNIDCIVGQMRAMGVSWNLQEACNQVLIAETYPAPSVIEQFYKRVYRYGQKQRCSVDIVLSGTKIDEALNGVRLRKGESDAKING